MEQVNLNGNLYKRNKVMERLGKTLAKHKEFKFYNSNNIN